MTTELASVAPVPTGAQRPRMPFRDWLVAIGGTGLPRRVPALPPQPLGERAWSDLRLAIRYQRLTGLAVQAADAGELPATPAQREELVEEHVEEMAHAVRLEQHIVRLSEILDDHAIRFVVLKGSAVAHLDYPDPALRSFADVDILFRPDDLDRALEVLTRNGYPRFTPPPVAEFDRKYGKGATLLSQDNYEIDVHRTFAMGPYAHTVDPGDLWEGVTPFHIAGRDCFALGTEQRLLHGCFHAVVGNPHDRIQPRRDVAEMFLYGSYDCQRLLDLAARWQALPVVARALTETWSILGIEPASPLINWARSRVPTRHERRILSVYAEGSSYATKALASLSVMSWRDRAAFVRMLVLPEQEFLASHGGSRTRWVARGALRSIPHTRHRK